MRHSSFFAAVVIVLTAGVAACGRVALELPDGVGGGADPGSGGGLGSGGAAGSSLGAGGAPAGAGGRGSGGVAGVGGFRGTGGATIDCAFFTESSCRQLAPTCRADYCPRCPGDAFVRCSSPSAPPFDCGPAPPCVPPPPCASATSFDECDARSDCHPVFVDLTPSCNCSGAGCCVMFQRCAEAPYAHCQAPVLWFCPAMSPSPFCGAGYVLSYTNICYEGCVRKQDCDGL